MSNFDFSNLQKAEVQKSTVEFPLAMLEGCPVLHILPASEANRNFFNALLKRMKKPTARGKTIDAIDANRAEDKELYSKHIVKGWAKVKDATGKEVPFTSENCLEYLQALPNWIFDNMRLFASNPANFIQDEEEEADVEEVAKNSPSA